MTWEIVWASASGIMFASVMLWLAIRVANPTLFQVFVFRTVLALSAGSMAAAIPGFLQIQFDKTLLAGGALAVFCIVYLMTPKSLTPHPEKLVPTTPNRTENSLTRDLGTIDELLREFKDYCEGPPADSSLRLAVARLFAKGTSVKDLLSIASGVPWRESRYKTYVQRAQVVNSTLGQFQQFVIIKCDIYRQDSSIASPQAVLLESLLRRLRFEG